MLQQDLRINRQHLYAAALARLLASGSALAAEHRRDGDCDEGGFLYDLRKQDWELGLR